jgi:hypothetical protein
VQLVTNPDLSDELRARLIALWVEVANAGGAVGFVRPTTTADVAPVAHGAFERVAVGWDDLVVALTTTSRSGWASWSATRRSWRATSAWSAVCNAHRRTPAGGSGPPCWPSSSAWRTIAA